MMHSDVRMMDSEAWQVENTGRSDVLEAWGRVLEAWQIENGVN